MFRVQREITGKRSVVLIFSYLAVKHPDQFGISVIVRYNYKLPKNESIARQLPAESQRRFKKVVLRTLSTGTNCYAKNTTEFLNEGRYRSFPLKWKIGSELPILTNEMVTVFSRFFLAYFLE